MIASILGLDCEVDLDGAVIGASANGHELDVELSPACWEMLASELERVFVAGQRHDAEEYRRAA
ncbi:hypothetical protein [Crenobacter cavernae]|uniref:DUF397 domain-containing protein n=1 Tax=Crenobacter cavernae TaxID=2290923 RepID=A0ABY0FAJ2_9NEIS|nr:hypothetical protein [Crenobacter cavernae]RXZ42665.1 hypothetical protein EBB06_12275 [Crenobacter cavernae]